MSLRKSTAVWLAVAIAAVCWTPVFAQTYQGGRQQGQSPHRVSGLRPARRPPNPDPRLPESRRLRRRQIQGARTQAERGQRDVVLPESPDSAARHRQRRRSRPGRERPRLLLRRQRLHGQRPVDGQDRRQGARGLRRLRPVGPGQGLGRVCGHRRQRQGCAGLQGLARGLQPAGRPGHDERNADHPSGSDRLGRQRDRRRGQDQDGLRQGRRRHPAL